MALARQPEFERETFDAAQARQGLVMRRKGPVLWHLDICTLAAREVKFFARTYGTKLAQVLRV
jgi:hypothetical protein